MDRKPDFVVVAVDKPHVAQVAAEWLGYGFAVLAETPAATDRETLEKDFRGAREEAAALLDEETAVQLLPEIRNDTVRNALIRRIADPRRRCRLGYHDYEDTGESFSRETGDTRSIYSVLRCRVCGCRTNHMEESYKF